MTEHLSTGQVIEATGLTFRQLHHWRDTGVLDGLGIHPATPTGEGSGRNIHWSADDVPKLRQMATLLRAGLTLTAAAAAVSNGGHIGEGVMVTIHRKCVHDQLPGRCPKCLAVEPIDLMPKRANVMIGEHAHRLWVCTEDGTILRIKCNQVTLEDLRINPDPPQSEPGKGWSDQPLFSDHWN